MAEPRLDRIDFRELFPWLHLFRGLRMALDLKKIALGAIGALLISLGWLVIDVGKFEKRESTSTQTTADRLPSPLFEQLSVGNLPWNRPSDQHSDVYTSPIVSQNGRSFFMVVEPIKQIILPVIVILRDSKSTIAGVLMTVWSLLVWSVLGGASTRIAAVQMAREGQVGIATALKYSLRRIIDYFGAPLLPFIGIALIVLAMVAGGWLMLIPGVDVVLSLFWFLPLSASIVVAVSLIALVIGWPLMYAAVSAEATESFDALSRSFSYVLGRPWKYLFYWTVAIAFGGVVMMVATTIAYVVLLISQYSLSWSMSAEDVRRLHSYVPTTASWRDSFGPTIGEALPTGTKYTSALIISSWSKLLLMALIGFSYSYFWSASTIIYFLLRRDVDETEFDEVYLEEEEDEPFPTASPPPNPLGTVAPPPTRLNVIDPPRGSLPIIEPPR